MVLLVVSCAQVVWWVIDQRRVGRTLESSRLEGFELDRVAAERLLASGTDREELERLFPHLAFEGSGDRVTVDVAPAAREELAQERRSHVRQYGWESAFFLAVLLACISVLWRGLREEARLRQRHENFLASVSHELRSPLSSLRLQTETLQRRKLNEDRRHELLGRSQTDLDRLEGLVDNVLEAARLDDGTGRQLLAWEAEALDVTDAVERQLRTLPRDHGAERVSNRVPEGTLVLADRRALDTILRNLLANALRATSDGGSVVVEGETEADRVRVRVVDSGEGFESGEAEHLFEKFYRPGSALRGRGGGTGLGLYIVRQLARRGGGSVQAESAGPGHGATFELQLPSAESAA